MNCMAVSMEVANCLATIVGSAILICFAGIFIPKYKDIAILGFIFWLAIGFFLRYMITLGMSNTVC